jgi:AraC family transcriptional regulator
MGVRLSKSTRCIGKHSRVKKMRVAVDVLGFVREPYLQVHHEHVVGMQLRPGFIEMGMRRSEMTMVTLEAGEIGLCPSHMQQWVGTADLERLSLGISDAALMAICDGMSGEVELRHECKLVDARVSALVAAVNAERLAGFPSGRLFLDSVEQALAAALVDGHAVRRPSLRMYRGGLSPARLRRVTELVFGKVEDELTLQEMAESAGLSMAHFSQMFRRSTGESPHQFVLRHRVERAKEMLRAAEARMLDVAVACGFKTQQHFARVFRRVCGTSPTEYRQEFLR